MNRKRIAEGIRHLYPAYFALPMSTGVISIASFILGYTAVSDVLFVINNIEIVLLLSLLILRILFYFRNFKNDLSTTKRGAGFLTVVIAICVLGVSNIVLKGRYEMAIFNWYLAISLWVLLVYAVSISTILRRKKPSFKDAITGTWLLFVVSAQALSILGNFIIDDVPYPRHGFLFLTFLLYILGGLFYLIIITLISFRYAFFHLDPDEFRPSYWINMGAAAISTLAGDMLILNMENTTPFQEFVPIIKVFTIIFWLGATWWIPIIAYLELWKRRSIPISYHPNIWSLVFPLGVYTLCTWRLGGIMGINSLRGISEGFIFIAWAAWLILFLRMLFSVRKNYFPSSSDVKGRKE